MARNIQAYLELPNDGSLHAIRIYVKSDDGKDLTYQEILDAVSDTLIDEMVFNYEKDDRERFDA